ncbi:isoflavone reductase family [Fusarium albosuccineum]|uniref:Isoflavone reductase family n=1 Tax=Fusarium albosuccineum TaxID=1237068 RepID=A0A8H4L451_9HYPO|nr:isoflavone reductase family [Fusarium albosuccineum]
MIKVAIAGATGETGFSIVNGLLESSNPKFDIVALTRPSSIEKAQTLGLPQRGVKIVGVDLNGPQDELVKHLSGVDVVISAVDPSAFSAQIPLANAAKAANVSRFIPCSFATVGPPTGVMQLREMKEEIINHIKKIHLPYTIIDVGWWFQLSIPTIPSGRTKYAALAPANTIAGDGTVLSALTDSRDIGLWVARIIADPRTLNKMVLAYNELLSQNQVHELLEKLSGEKTERQHMAEQALLDTIEEAKKSDDPRAVYKVWNMQYLYSYGIRGDNNPEYAKYLGYLDATELYPDLKVNKLESFFQEVLDGKATSAYARKYGKA